jgi:putative two-component system response regulator
MYKILIVDDEVANLKLLQNILEDDYQLSFATTGEKALKIAVAIQPDLILLDVMMPELDGFEACRRLKANIKTAGIPVIFVTALSDAEDEIKGFNSGGVDFIRKPISSHLVQARVSAHISLYNKHKECEIAIEKRTKELEVSNRAAIAMLAEAGHFNDTDTGVHVWRMSAYAGAIGRAAGWSIEHSRLLELAATMHDTGKIGIPDSILKKPGPLTNEEFDVIKTHTTIGNSILNLAENKSQLFTMAADIAFYHHEKWNGKGYPNHLAEKKIPESARISAIADVFDALTMRRPYKEPWSVEAAFAEIEKGRGSHFDPQLVDCFLEIKEEILQLKDEWEKKETNYDWFSDEGYIAIL